MRYFLQLSYRGTAYSGWQRQLNAPSVQQTLEDALSTMLRDRVEVTGAGRTDAGVHAARYVAHFDVPEEVDVNFCRRLNAILPGDVAVHNAVRVADGAHARFDAREREYRYYILPYKDPFRRDTAWQYYVPLDIEAMNEAAAMLPLQDDFAAFSKLHSNNKTTICRVCESRWIDDNGCLTFIIASDRFLRNMVRSLVGTLVDVGRGRISPDEFGGILRSCDRSRASGSAPAHGLFLTDVRYDGSIFKHE